MTRLGGSGDLVGRVISTLIGVVHRCRHRDRTQNPTYQVLRPLSMGHGRGEQDWIAVLPKQARRYAMHICQKQDQRGVSAPALKYVHDY